MSLLGWRSRGPSSQCVGWSLQVETHGRWANLLYSEKGQSVSFFFELGGAVGGFIYPPKDWPWPASRRDEVMRRVAEEVIHREFAGYRFEVDQSGVATILK